MRPARYFFSSSVSTNLVVDVGLVTETNSPLSPEALTTKFVDLNLLAETDSVFPVVPDTDLIVDAGLVVETDSIFSVTPETTSISGDPLWDNVVARSLADGADQSTTITDVSQYAHPVNVNGNAQLDTAVKKWGSASLLLDGTGDFVSVNEPEIVISPSTNFAFECWILPDALNKTYASGRSLPGTENNYWIAYPDSNGALVFQIRNGASTFYTAKTANGVIAANVDFHFVRIERFNGIMRAEVDGVVGATTDDASGVAMGLNQLAIGGFLYTGFEDYFDGHIDDWRMTIGHSVTRIGTGVPIGPMPTGPDSSTVDVGLVAETDTLLSVTPDTALAIDVGLVEEIDSLRPLAKVVTTGLVEETNELEPLAKIYYLGFVTENDTTLSLSTGAAGLCVKEDNHVFTVVPIIAPVIVTDPQPVTGQAGEVVTFTVVATGTFLEYQWYDQNGLIEGANLATYIRELVIDDDGEDVYVIVSNPSTAVQSANAGMTVTAAEIDYILRLGRYREPFYKNGTIILSRPLVAGEQIVIERKTPIINETTFAPQEQPEWRTFEKQIDRLTMVAQEIEGHLCECRECVNPTATVTVVIEQDPERPECSPYACDAVATYTEGNYSPFIFSVNEPAYGSVFPQKAGKLTFSAPTIVTLGWGEGTSASRITTPVDIDLPDFCNLPPQPRVLETHNSSTGSAGNNGILVSDSAGFLNSTPGGAEHTAGVLSETFLILFKPGGVDSFEYLLNNNRVPLFYNRRFFQSGTSVLTYSGLQVYLGIDYDDTNQQARLYTFTSAGGIFPTNPPNSVQFGPWLDFDTQSPYFSLVRASINVSPGYIGPHRNPPDGRTWSEAELSIAYTLEICHRRGDGTFDTLEDTVRVDYYSQQVNYVLSNWTVGTNLETPTVSQSQYSYKISEFGSFKIAGVGSGPEIGALGLEELCLAAQRNYSTYEVPGSCGGGGGGGKETVSPVLDEQEIEVPLNASVEISAAINTGTPPVVTTLFREDVEIGVITPEAPYSFTFAEPFDGVQWSVVASNECSLVTEVTRFTFVSEE